VEKAESLFQNDPPRPAQPGRRPGDPRAIRAALDEGPSPLSWDERLELLDAAARALRARIQGRQGAPPESPEARLAERLGWPRWPGEEDVVARFEALRESHELRIPHEGSGLSLCAPDWRELTCEAFTRVALEIAHGRACILCADERAPELAELLHGVLVGAGFPGERLALSGSARRETLECWCAAGGVGSLSASGSAASIVELRRFAWERGLTDQRLRSLRCSSFVLEEREDVHRAAERVALSAFGPETCGGQLPGQIARAFVPQERYSSFVEALLEGLGSCAQLSSPVPHVDRAAARLTQRAWIQGLDEGATMISGGEEEMTADSLRLPPTVFCNVEPHMRSARRQDPMPVQCLLRSS